MKSAHGWGSVGALGKRHLNGESRCLSECLLLGSSGSVVLKPLFCKHRVRYRIPVTDMEVLHENMRLPEISARKTVHARPQGQA
jgi:hypothetical protein